MHKNATYSGWLHKKGGGKSIVLGSSMKKRWFFITRHRLYYCHSEGTQYINFIVLDAKTVLTDWEGNEGYGFKLQTSYTQRIYFLLAERESEREKWKEEIALSIKTLQETNPAEAQWERLVQKMDSPPADQLLVLDVLLMEAEFQDKGKAPQCKAKVKYVGEKFATWSTEETEGKSFLWNVGCTFILKQMSGKQGFRVCLFQKKKKIDGKLASATVNFSVNDRTQKEGWINLEGRSPGRIRIAYQVSLYFDRKALLADKGIACKALPVRLDSGDIILSNSNHVGAFGTKLVTWCQWDHVALVVRDSDNVLKTLEASTRDGVSLFYLDDRLNEIRQYTKIAVRHLNAERGKDFWIALYNFMQSVRGRPYKKHKLELLKATQSRNQNENLTSIFCSELVAAAYQRMSIMSFDKPSNDYLPKTWSSKHNDDLSFIGNACLERKFIFKSRAKRNVKDDGEVFHKGRDLVTSISPERSCPSRSSRQLSEGKKVESERKPPASLLKRSVSSSKNMEIKKPMEVFSRRKNIN